MTQQERIQAIEKIINSHFSVMTFPENNSANQELRKLATAIEEAIGKWDKNED